MSGPVAGLKKFELEEPPVVFSLVPRAPGSGGSLSHLGFRVAGAEQVRQAQQRLAAAGICTQDQNGTVCGYARQDKVWVRDPDGNFWEIYAIDEEVEPAEVRRSVEGPARGPCRVREPARQRELAVNATCLDEGSHFSGEVRSEERRVGKEC